VVLRLAWVPAEWIAAVASVTAGLPAARIPWPQGAAGAVALTVATGLGAAAVALGRGRPRRIGDDGRGG
jgi:competence protein ComEC